MNVNNSKNDEDNKTDDDDDDEFETVKIPGLENENNEEELRYLGFLNGRDSEYSRNFELNINLKFGQNEDNKILIDIIKDLYKEVKYSHLDLLNNWIKVFFLPICFYFNKICF